VFAAKVAVPEVMKQRTSSSDIVLRLKRSDCSHGSVGHTVAYRVSYCTAESDTGELALTCDSDLGMFLCSVIAIYLRYKVTSLSCTLYYMVQLLCSTTG